MIAALQVHYHQDRCQTAAVLFHDWSDAKPHSTLVTRSSVELPEYSFVDYEHQVGALQSILAEMKQLPQAIIVEGCTWLSERERGLGAHLYHALDRHIPVIAVSRVKIEDAIEVNREHRPLYVTSLGLTPDTAGLLVSSMHGEFCTPTLLQLAIELSRQRQ